MRKPLFDLLPGEGILQGWREIAEYLGVSVITARRRFASGTFPVQRTISRRPFAFKISLNNFMIAGSKIIDKEIKKDRDAVCKHTAMMRSCKRGNEWTNPNV